MLTPEQVTALRDAAGQLTDPITEFLLADIARRISEAGQLTSTAAYQVWRVQQLGVSQKEIKKKLREILKVSTQKIEKLLTQSAEVGYDFDIKNLPHANAVSFAENESLQQILSAAVQLAQEDFTNLTQTLGMVDPFGNALPLQDVYRSCTDFAFKQVITGATDYNTAIRRATKHLASKGVRVIDYESGVHTSIEAAVRRNIMGGLGLMQEQITQHNHDELGCDGWEISAHANSAPDHEPIQGKQYTDAEYTALNNSLVRRIGTLNCGHAAFPVILGINEPQYTPEELEKFRTDNEKGITYEGEHYTGYEATQMQRKLERAIRTQKRRILVDEAVGDKDKLLTDQTKLQRLRQEYGRFSKAAGLRTQDERAQVAGFGRGEAARASVAAKTPPKPVASAVSVEKKNTSKPFGVDVLDEYIGNATPNVGTITFDDGYDVGSHASEARVAQWLHETFGGDIVLLNESTVENEKRADYLWNGKLWDLKSTTTEKAANTAIKRGLAQIKPNPGGVILDYENHQISTDLLQEVIDKRMQWLSEGSCADVLVVRDGKVVKVLRYKK